MSTMLEEGKVIRFISERANSGYKEDSCAKIGRGKESAFEERADDVSRTEKEYVVVKTKESFPQVTIGNRWTSYENTIWAKELGEGGVWKDGGELVEFSTCGVYRDAFSEEEDIEIVRTMKKIFV